MMSTNCRDEISQIIDLTEKIDRLEASGSWREMQGLVEQRFTQIRAVFGRLESDGSTLAPDEITQLRSVIESNQRILGKTSARRADVARHASDERRGAVAVDTYQHFSSQ